MKNIFGSKKEAIILLLIFLFVFFFRLFFVVQDVNFSSDEAYFHYRNVEHILQEGNRLSYDPLSYGGREIYYPGLFHFLLAGVGLLFPLLVVFKFIPELLISMLVFVVYLIAKKLTGAKSVALVTAFLSGFLPLLYDNVLNQISIYSLILPMFFFLIYCMMKMREEKQYMVYFVIFSIILALTHPSSFLLILTLVMYSLIILSESWKIRRINREAIIFSIFVIILIQFLIFKKAFLNYGLDVLWQNIPRNVLNSYFADFNILSIITKIGFVPIVLGVIALYYGVFKEKNDSFYLLAGVMLSTLLLLLLKLINFSVGLMFLGVTLTILSSLTILRFMRYLHITKFSKFSRIFSLLFILLIILFSLMPSYNIAEGVMDEVPAKEDIEALAWIKKNIEEEATILVPLEEGHILTALTGKTNVVDDYFLMVFDVEERVEDVDNLFKLKSEVLAIDLLNEYGIDYIFLSDRTKKQYDLETLEYTSDERCFHERKYENKFYQIRDC